MRASRPALALHQPAAHQIQRLLRRPLAARGRAVAAEIALQHVGLLRVAHRNVDQAHGLALRAAAGPRNARDSQPQRRAGALPNALLPAPSPPPRSPRRASQSAPTARRQTPSSARRSRPPPRPETTANCPGTDVMRSRHHARRCSSPPRPAWPAAVPDSREQSAPATRPRTSRASRPAPLPVLPASSSTRCSAASRVGLAQIRRELDVAGVRQDGRLDILVGGVNRRQQLVGLRLRNHRRLQRALGDVPLRRNGLQRAAGTRPRTAACIRAADRAAA